MHSTISAVIKPLLERKIFATEEEAVRELVKDYILRQITHYQRENIRLTRKYGMLDLSRLLSSLVAILQSHPANL